MFRAFGFQIDSSSVGLLDVRRQRRNSDAQTTTATIAATMQMRMRSGGAIGGAFVDSGSMARCTEYEKGVCELSLFLLYGQFASSW